MRKIKSKEKYLTSGIARGTKKIYGSSSVLSSTTSSINWKHKWNFMTIYTNASHDNKPAITEQMK